MAGPHTSGCSARTGFSPSQGALLFPLRQQTNALVPRPLLRRCDPRSARSVPEAGLAGRGGARTCDPRPWPPTEICDPTTTTGVQAWQTQAWGDTIHGYRVGWCVSLVWSALRPGRPRATRRAGLQRELGRTTAWRADAAPGRRSSPSAP